MLTSLRKYLPIVLLIILSSCSEEDVEEAPQPLAAPSIRDVDGITENGVGFTVFGASGNEVELQYSTSDLFTDPTTLLLAPSDRNVRIDGLSEATRYFFRLRAVSENDTSNYSGINEINTLLGSTSVSLTTNDDVDINASLRLPAERNDKVPVVVFVHSFAGSENEWLIDKSFFLKDFVDAGFAVMTLDLRNHGESGNDPTISNIGLLLDSPDGFPRDMIAVHDFLVDMNEIDATKMVIVGASLGSNIATVANGSRNLSYALSVALSPRTSRIDNLSGSLNSLDLSGMYFIASSNDGNGDREMYATELFSLTTNPRKLTILRNSSAHGAALIDDPGTSQMIFNWILDNI